MNTARKAEKNQKFVAQQFSLQAQEQEVEEVEKVTRKKI